MPPGRYDKQHFQIIGVHNANGGNKMKCYPQTQIYSLFEVGLKNFLRSHYLNYQLSLFHNESDCQGRVNQRRIKIIPSGPSPFKVALPDITYIKMIGRGLKKKANFLKIILSSQHHPFACHPFLFKFSPYNFTHRLLGLLFCNIICNCNIEKQYNRMLQKFAHTI